MKGPDNFSTDMLGSLPCRMPVSVRAGDLVKVLVRDDGLETRMKGRVVSVSADVVRVHLIDGDERDFPYDSVLESL